MIKQEGSVSVDADVAQEIDFDRTALALQIVDRPVVGQGTGNLKGHRAGASADVMKETIVRYAMQCDASIVGNVARACGRKLAILDENVTLECDNS